MLVISMVSDVLTILFITGVSENTTQSKTAANLAVATPKLQLPTNHAIPHVLPAQVRYPPAEVRPRIWDDRLNLDQPQTTSLPKRKRNIRADIRTSKPNPWGHLHWKNVLRA